MRAQETAVGRADEDGGPGCWVRVCEFDDIALGQRLVGAVGRRAGMTLGEIMDAAVASAELLQAGLNLSGRPVLARVRLREDGARSGVELALDLPLPRHGRLDGLESLGAAFDAFEARRRAEDGRLRLAAVRWKRRGGGA